MARDVGDGMVLVKESPLGRLYVYWEEYKSNMFLHIRYWYHNKKQDIWAPSSKGIAIPEANVAPILEAIRVVLGQPR